ncbi:alpha/beta hydrolase-fold protein [Herpetosiphon gulosus]|uniref:Esterase n=1 Tax=Herpetosiphon gulosus TaxID=1973496 RepID=A0ABP9WUW2_9CHLR
MQTIELSDATGFLERYANMDIPGLLPRNVDVWLPANYHSSSEAFPVIYIHDGQNVFDPALAYIGVDLGVDEALENLIATQTINGAIVVGIWNSEQRIRDYLPAKPFYTANAAAQAQFVAAVGGVPLSDQYLAWIVKTLKPQIDATYRTHPEPEHTSIMGASMGGIISLYALVEYPKVFGNAGCLSTHWPIGASPLVRWFGQRLPKPNKHRLYFDFGTEGLDAEYEPYQREMDGWMQAAGYRQSRNWLTKKFVGADHSEHAWRERIELPLAFLLGASV